MKGLTEGRIVHYVLPEVEGTAKVASPGRHVPALVVRVWDDVGLATLVVFVDINDIVNIDPHSTPSYWATSIEYSEDKEPGTWHWIEPA